MAICRLCHDSLPQKNRRTIFSDTFKVINQLIEVLGYIPRVNDEMSSYICGFCFTKLNKLSKIDFDICHRVETLRNEKLDLMKVLRAKYLDTGMAQPKTPGSSLPSSCLSPDKQSTSQQVKRPWFNSPTPRKVKKPLLFTPTRTRTILPKLELSATGEMEEEKEKKRKRVSVSLFSPGKAKFIYQIFYKSTSAGDKGTLFHLRNFISRIDVRGSEEVVQKYRSHYSFVEDSLDSYIVAACMHLLDLSEINAEPVRKQPLFDILPEDEKYRYISKVSEDILEKYIKITNDNNEELGYDYENHQLSADECKRRASFIKWYPENSCDTHQLQHQYWTSGRRHIVKFRLWKSYMPENVKLMKCLILNKDNGEKRKSCKNDVFPFFCRFGSAKEIISSPTVTIPPQQKIAQSDKSESIAAGTVTSCIVVIAVIVVLIFLRRRRLSNEKQTRHASTSFENVKGTVKEQICNTTSQSAVYHEIEVQNFRPQNLMLNSQTVNNIPYNQVNSDRTPKSQNVNQSAKNTIQTKLNSVDFQRKVSQNEYEMSKVINENGNSSEGVSSSNYCLAKPITSSTEDELDPYDINKDYDHLNIVKKKEDLITKVYDHLPTAVTDDPTYDHSNLNSTLDNEDYYDHFKNDGDND